MADAYGRPSLREAAREERRQREAAQRQRDAETLVRSQHDYARAFSRRFGVESPPEEWGLPPGVHRPICGGSTIAEEMWATVDGVTVVGRYVFEEANWCMKFYVNGEIVWTLAHIADALDRPPIIRRWWQRLLDDRTETK